MAIDYPVRCRIIDVTGMEKFGLELATPDVSRPHIGKEGLAELINRGETVRITLDDGKVIYGCDCWWEPLVEEVG